MQRVQLASGVDTLLPVSDSPFYLFSVSLQQELEFEDSFSSYPQPLIQHHHQK
jgi:hypothetical protein